jgi:murein DD-endopeptidase MepM/ murein hydrolase activator NlpD
MKILTAVKNFRSVTNDPFGFIVDTLIKVLVNLIIPIPLAGDVVARLKGPVLGFLASMLILGVMLFVILITIFVSIFLSPTGFFQYITSSILSATLESANPDFVQSSNPSQNPFGGQGMSYASVTAGFMDLSYLLQFGKNHTGIDLVPGEVYYQNSKTYLQNKKIVIFSTHIGKAKVYTDENGGKTVEVENNDASLKTIYIHFKEIYVKTGDAIQGGTPLGEMGDTGFATGEHLHYEVRIKNGTNWLAVSPLKYIR